MTDTAAAMTRPRHARSMSLEGNIERRVLINYRLDPEVARRLLPQPFRPQLVDGVAVAGVCFIRLGGMRPSGLGSGRGWRGESSAHRIAVEWESEEGMQTGVYVPERHSASWLPVVVGGRVFPGTQRRARFAVREDGTSMSLALTASDAFVAAEVDTADEWTSTLFPTVDAASDFFREGNVAWSPARRAHEFEGLELETSAWRVTAGRADAVRSSFFDALPKGSAILDDVLIMRDVPVRWTTPRATTRPLAVRIGAAR
jgi:hypothetical protein